MTLKVCWMRKVSGRGGVLRAFAVGRLPHCKVRLLADCVPGHFEMVESDRILAVTPRQFSRIFNGLPKFADVLGAGVPALPDCFIVTDKSRFLAVMRQGFDYPRYKSFLEPSVESTFRRIYMGVGGIRP